MEGKELQHNMSERDRGTVGSAFSVFLSSERTSGNQKKLEEKKILVH